MKIDIKRIEIKIEILKMNIEIIKNKYKNDKVI